jgi:hypothetical protein
VHTQNAHVRTHKHNKEAACGRERKRKLRSCERHTVRTFINLPQASLLWPQRQDPSLHATTPPSNRTCISLYHMHQATTVTMAALRALLTTSLLKAVTRVLSSLLLFASLTHHRPFFHATIWQSSCRPYFFAQSALATVQLHYRVLQLSSHLFPNNEARSQSQES